ncbi:hypothetical protein [Microbacterium sp. zg.Y1084]|uniref:hypothetical protein n=1 Tax=Microbacterium sp. zg.Y1084 TaxID=2969667 RepID=UPI00214BD5BE|nr:hypothetical protein [Microbacterium sp. zg.Y1084]MCR2812883.1 hypothetical protein [Microbacterium sp. zg.Y1084]
MSLKKIKPNQDAYGNLARASFFADYMELLALKGHRNRKNLLADLIADTYARSREILTDVGSAGTEDWEPADLADSTWGCLEQRAQILGNKYPFIVSPTSVSFRVGVDPEESPYLSLLAIALNHAFSASRDLLVENLFEDVVGDSLESRGLHVGRFGEIGRDATLSFEQSMNQLSQRMTIAMNPNAVVRRVSAQDAGVDVVGHLDWQDTRVGRWLFIGQVTCARSDEWHTKIYDAVPDDWMAYFGETVPPVPFLALPYHVEDAAMEHFRGRQRHILDRIRIVMSLTGVRAEAKTQIRALMNAEMQTFSVN